MFAVQKEKDSWIKEFIEHVPLWYRLTVSWEDILRLMADWKQVREIFALRSVNYQVPHVDCC